MRVYQWYYAIVLCVVSCISLTHKVLLTSAALKISNNYFLFVLRLGENKMYLPYIINCVIIVFRLLITEFSLIRGYDLCASGLSEVLLGF